MGQSIFGGFARKSFAAIIVATLLYNSVLEFVDEDDEEKVVSKPKRENATAKLIKKAKEDKHGAQPGQNIGCTQDASASEDVNGVLEGDEDETVVPDTLPENALFIPFGFVRQRPATFYKGSDPEWQGFFDFAAEPRRIKAVQAQLAGHVVRHLASNPKFQAVLGTPISLSRSWLDIDFPDGPPPEYERSGIEITEDYVAWTTRPISSVQYSRLRAILQPVPMLSALWTSYRLSWTLQLARFKAFLNLDPQQDQSNTGGIPGLFNLRYFGNVGYKQDSHLGAKIEEFPESQAEHAEEGLVDGEQFSKSEDSIPPKDPQISPMEDDMKAALETFKQTLAKKWKQPEAVIERGALIISGMLEMQGPRASCVMDVRATYLPKESRYIAIGASVRRFQLRKQSPKGGS